MSSSSSDFLPSDEDRLSRAHRILDRLVAGGREYHSLSQVKVLLVSTGLVYEKDGQVFDHLSAEQRGWIRVTFDRDLYDFISLDDLVMDGS